MATKRDDKKSFVIIHLSNKPIEHQVRLAVESISEKNATAFLSSQKRVRNFALHFIAVCFKPLAWQKTVKAKQTDEKKSHTREYLSS